jgi:hypothetical protein
MTRTTTTIDDISGADLFDLRDVIARVEELEDILEGYEDQSGSEYDDEKEELGKLMALLNEVKGYGGDEQWRGDWYPVSFIRDSYFTEYAEDLVKDISDMPRDIPSYIEIDWEATARNIRQDYSSVEFDGETYWYR